MIRTLPDPNIALGIRRDGRAIFPVLGASSDDPSNDEVSVSISQKQLSTMMAREKDQGGRAAVRSLVEKLGFASAAALEEHLTSLRQAAQDQLTETERREQAVTEREKEAIAREATALARERDARHRAALVTAGVTGRDLDDAVALLRVPDDADTTVLDEAVQELSGRRPELFNASARQLPPAPGGAPVSVPPPRPGSAERQPGAAGLEMARRRGFLPDSN